MKDSPKRNEGFTLVELLAIIAVVALLAVVFIPAAAGSRTDAQAFQCQNNEKQLTLAWQMYAEDNRDLLAPNDYPYETAYFNYPNRGWMQNWVVGSMVQPFDSRSPQELVPTTQNLHTNTCLAGYVTNASRFRCPADLFVDPFSHTQRVRSYSMNSAVGTLWWSSSRYTGGSSAPPIGAPMQGGWLNGDAYGSSSSQRWLTYDKMTAFTKPGPANTFVIMEESSPSIHDPSMKVPAEAAAGATYLVAYPAANHNGSGCISFADGHVVIHRWLDARTLAAQLILPGEGIQTPVLQTPDDPDCFYLAPITSALK